MKPEKIKMETVSLGREITVRIHTTPTNKILMTMVILLNMLKALKVILQVLVICVMTMLMETVSQISQIIALWWQTRTRRQTITMIQPVEGV